MKKVTYAFLAITMIMVCSCKKILDTTPKDFVTVNNFPKNANDATEMLNGAFFQLHNRYVFGGEWLVRAQAGDDLYMTNTGPNYPSTFYIQATEGTYVPTFWNTMYSVINTVNTLIKYLPQATMDTNSRNAIMGEALFLRAFAYSYLVDQWGAVPLKTEPSEDATKLNIARSPIADVYKQILADLAAAEPLVPSATSAAYGAAGYPPKTAVQGLYARVCLTMAGYPLNDVSKYADAKTWCAKVIASGLHSLNPSYSQFFSNLAQNIYDKKESIWEIDMYDPIGVSVGGYVGYLDGVPSTSLVFGVSTGYSHALPHLFNLYAAGTTSLDLRRDWVISPYVYKTPATPDLTQVTLWGANIVYQRNENKYRVYLTPQPHTTGNTPINFPILRYADILLMYAEADNQVNNAPSALDYTYVNMVRERAYGVGQPGVTTTAAQADVAQTYNHDTFQQLIEDERCREFPAEGLRKHDLVRWNIYISSIKAAGSTAAATTGDSGSANVVNLANRAQPRDVLWPIPANELTNNKLMTQNPGW